MDPQLRQCQTEIIKKNLLNVLRNYIAQIRKILHMIFEVPSSSIFALLICSLILFTIALSLAIIIVDSVMKEKNENYERISSIFELIIFIIFSLEFIIRLTCYTAFGNNISQFIKDPMNIIVSDFISLIPFIIEVNFASQSVKGLQVVRVAKFVRIFRIMKLNRYLSGFQLLTKGVQKSLNQFSFLFAAFIITILAFSVMIYFSEIQQDIKDDSTVHTITGAIWLCLTTISTVGYGDVTPKSLLARIITSFLAFFANTIILSLPIAILGRDFQEVYETQKEKERINKIKTNLLGTQLTIEQRDFKFIKQRMNMIEEKNKKILELIEKSSKIAQIVTKDLQKLYASINNESHLNQEHQYSKTPMNKKRFSIYNLKEKASIFEKIQRTKQKIKITNIIKNMGKKNKNLESVMSSQLESSSRNKSNSRKFQLIKQCENRGRFKMNLIEKKKILIKSNSVENENELIKLRNEKLGYIPYEFLNEILLQLQEEEDIHDNALYVRLQQDEVNQQRIAGNDFLLPSNDQNDDQFASSYISRFEQSMNPQYKNQTINRSITLNNKKKSEQLPEEYEKQYLPQKVKYFEQKSINLNMIQQQSSVNKSSFIQEKSQLRDDEGQSSFPFIELPQFITKYN